MKYPLSTSRRRFLGGAVATAAWLAHPRLLAAEANDIAFSAAPPLDFPPSVESAQSGLLSKWSPKTGPLMTRWSSSVDPNAPLPFYPRPQMVRKTWMNLNGVWEYQAGVSANDAPPFGKSLSGTILVPYPVESALSGVMEHHDRLWYRRSFAVPPAWRGKQLLLHFGAVDYESEVFVNGKSIGIHKGGYTPFHYDITSALKEGDNELVVRVFDPTEKGGQPRGKQNTSPRGITYTPTTGIWQTVWLEPVDATSIDSMTIVPDIDRSVLRLTVHSAKAPAAATIAVVIKAGDSVVAKATATANKEIEVAIPNPKLWSPDSPFLYTLELALKTAGRTADSVNSYFAMRKTHVGDVGGQKKLLLNNKFDFQFGPLDQGFWPDGIYTAPTDDALKNDIVQMKAMGFNMVRKHIKVEPARWYYWADTLGLLVWQDMPSCNSYPGRQFTPPPEDKEAFETELKSMIETLKNVPSIVLWIIFNEGQGQFDTERLVDLVHGLDPSRPVNEASGGEIKGSGEVNDIHSYPEPAVRPPNGKQALTCGEFGGIGFLIPDHSWQRSGHGYVEVDTPEDLLYLYAQYIEGVRDLRDNGHLSAAIYTELTDVMTEINGLLTYDRVPKLPVEIVKRVNTFQFKAPTYKTVLPTSQEVPQNWKYTFSKPEDEWSGRNFDDSQWQQGPGAFGSAGDHIGTKWTAPDLWIRLHFNPGMLAAEQLKSLVLTEFHRGRIEIFINGIATPPQQGNNRSLDGYYEHRPLLQATRQAILSNTDNVIAVHCHTAPNLPTQFFDAGLSLRLP
jgi:hypothetical protein